MGIVTALKSKRKFKPFAALMSWWKRRRFRYLEEDVALSVLVEGNTELDMHEHVGISTKNTETSTLSPGSAATPLALYFDTQESPKRPKKYPFQRSSTLFSLQNSIESMDSVVDSHWDPDDTSMSQAHTKSIKCHGDSYLMEHLHFLSISTQPQEVDLMYDNN